MLQRFHNTSYVTQLCGGTIFRRKFKYINDADIEELTPKAEIVGGGINTTRVHRPSLGHRSNNKDEILRHIERSFMNLSKIHK